MVNNVHARMVRSDYDKQYIPIDPGKKGLTYLNRALVLLTVYYRP